MKRDNCAQDQANINIFRFWRLTQKGNPQFWNSLQLIVSAQIIQRTPFSFYDMQSQTFPYITIRLILFRFEKMWYASLRSAVNPCRERMRRTLQQSNLSHGITTYQLYAEKNKANDNK